MARYPNFGEIAGVPCDECAEGLAVAHLKEVSLCDDCFERNVSDFLESFFGRKICGAILWPTDTIPALCLRDKIHGFHD